MSQTAVIYQGTNSLVLKKNSSIVLIDPYYSRVGLRRLLGKIRPNPQRVGEGLRSAGVDSINGILLTHTHYDHALDATEVVRQQGGVIYGSRSAVNLAKGAGLTPEHYQWVRKGEPYFVGSFRVVFHPSKHISFPPPVSWLLPEKGKIEEPLVTPAWFWDYRSGKVSAVQVDRLLIFGSAGSVPGAYKDLDIETVVLGIGGFEMKPFHYLRKRYHEVVIESGARRVLISHWDNFFNSDTHQLKFLGLAKQTLSRIEALGQQYGQEVRLLKIGERYLI